MNINRRYFTRFILHLSHTVFWGWSLRGCEYESLEDKEPIVNLTSFEGGERLFTSDLQIIQWNFSNVSKIDIELSTDGGDRWETLFSGVDTTLGKVEWKLPEIDADQCLLQIKDDFNGQILLVSGVFSIEKVKLGLDLSEHTELQTIGNVKRISSFSVRRTSDTLFTVLSIICTHQFCRVGWEEKENLFICPCHFSAFTPDGKVVEGPAEEPLETFEYEFFPDKDRLYIF